MSSYEELLKQAEENKTAKQISSQYKTFDKKGDRVIGRFMLKYSVKSSQGEGEYNQYLFDTDEGMIKFHLGRSGDTDVGEIMEKGRVYVVEYLGQEDIGHGRRVNKYDVFEIPETGSQGQIS